MMNSPWAMLMTFIWPKVKVSPSAMSSSVAPMPRPVKSCDSRLPIRLPSNLLTSRSLSLPPRVALEVRVGLDRLGRGRDLGDEAVGPDRADAGRLVEVLRGAVDGHRSLRCGIREPGGSSLHAGQVRGLRLVGSHGPQVHGGVARLHGVVDRLV